MDSQDYSVKVFDFRGLDPLSAAQQASNMIGLAVELTRDKYHVTRENLNGVILLKAIPTKRKGNG